jgi:hypothetical protein
MRAKTPAKATSKAKKIPQRIEVLVSAQPSYWAAAEVLKWVAYPKPHQTVERKEFQIALVRWWLRELLKKHEDWEHPPLVMTSRLLEPLQNEESTLRRGVGALAKNLYVALSVAGVQQVTSPSTVQRVGDQFDVAKLREATPENFKRALSHTNLSEVARKLTGKKGNDVSKFRHTHITPLIPVIHLACQISYCWEVARGRERDRGWYKSLADLMSNTERLRHILDEAQKLRERLPLSGAPHVKKTYASDRLIQFVPA